MKKVIISGGGTGGHIFPAISIANALKERFPDVEILFVGAENRMEMERVPAAGYKIVGLPVAGFNRRQPWKNIPVVLKLLKSLLLARKIVRDFRPDVAVGVGGYAGGPTLHAAARAGIPIVLQEQNCYAGVTNRLLARKASTICVAWPGMEAFFPKEKIVMTGNPVRRELLNINRETRTEAARYFGLNLKRKTILVLGGSLGAGTINRSILAHVGDIMSSGVQLIWQTGACYYDSIISSQEATFALPGAQNIHITRFITRMDLAYAVADLIISRAGAGSVSEFCLLGKPVILVPSPNVAEDHQTKNAMSLLLRDAAILVPDAEAEDRLIPLALQTVGDKARLRELSEHIRLLAMPRATENIVDEIVKVCERADRLAASAVRSDKSWDNFYFIGAGGIGMSALIRYFLSKGKRVAGYDKTPSAITRQLNRDGEAIHYDDCVALIPKDFKNSENTLVVYTPAVPNDHAELAFFRNNGFTVVKRAQVLGAITRENRAICIAGTHGKTTTSSMTAHLLKQSHVDCSAFLGGILKNYDSNLLLSAGSDLAVVEADEYDRSFHWLSPCMAAITSADSDHLDIYGTPAVYEESFNHFTSLIRPGGVLLMKKDICVHPRLQEGVRLYTYSAEAGGDFHAENIRTANGEIVFDYVAPDEKISDISLGVPLQINIENSIAAIALARLNGVRPDEIRPAMASFQGAERRFDFKLKSSSIVLIDDYAHHPKELKASISSVRELYPDRELTAVFQPHLYSRTRDFYPEFAKSLSLADEVILLDIYPAREAPIPGITSQLILDNMTLARKQICTGDGLLTEMASSRHEVVLMLGAGDIDRLVEPVKEILEKKIIKQ
jgi:UDP-N-acetylmuramate--alanine ligase